MPSSRSVEVNHAVSLAALLALAMGMTALVMLILWQRGMIQTCTTRCQTALTLAGHRNWTADRLDQLGPPVQGEDMLDIAVQSTEALCGALQLGTLRKFAGSTECPSEPLLSALREATGNGSAVTTTEGKTWGVVSPGPKYLIVAIPVSHESLTGAAGLVMPLDPVYRSMRHDQRLVLTYLLINLVILVAIGMFRFHKLTVSPINRLVRLADSYRDHEDASFPVLKERSEFSRLSNSLSRMLHRIEENREELQATVNSLEIANQKLKDTRQEMIRTEKMASVGRLAAGLAHEIGNPLGIIQGYLGLLARDGASEEERKDYSGRAEKELQRISALLRQLLDLSRSHADEYRPVSVHEILSELLPVMQMHPLARGITIRHSLNAQGDIVRGDRERLRQVFLNCLLNSFDAIRATGADSGLITVTTTEETGPILLVTIEDNGEGITSANPADLFDPFFTTKEPGKGTGLGLSVSLTIIENMGGQMEIEAGQEQGARVHIRLPRMEDYQDHDAQS